ncbi:MAG: hypothetical protein ACOYBY_07945 [Dermatophilaceae bacterium]
MIWTCTAPQRVETAEPVYVADVLADEPEEPDEPAEGDAVADPADPLDDVADAPGVGLAVLLLATAVPEFVLVW